MKRALLVATVSQSLLFQAPATLDALSKRGFRPVFAAAPDRWTPALAERGDFRALPTSRSPGVREALAARAQMVHLLREPWDLVQLQSPIASAVARSCRELRGPSIYVVHGFHFHRDGGAVSNAVFRQIEWVLAGRTSAIAVVSREDFIAARKMGFHRRGVLWRLPGAGVDLARFRPGPAPDRRPTVLFCGELNENKDPITAARAVAEVRRGGADVGLKIVGDGPLAAELVRMTANADWIEWHPSLTPADLAREMRACHALIAPSYREGLPRVIIEAIATGIPVVARSNRGSRELLEPLVPAGKGWLVTSSRIGDWASAVEAALASGPLDGSERACVGMYSADNFERSYTALLDVTMSGAARGSFDLDGQDGVDGR